MKYFCLMELKKSSRADLERGRGFRFAIGLVVVLAVVVVAFRWKTPSSQPVVLPPVELPALPMEASLPPVEMERPLDVPEESPQPFNPWVLIPSTRYRWQKMKIRITGISDTTAMANMAP